jgi:UDP-N-acetylglucosamine 2-epimerase (non-hydrolysing)
MVTILSVIGTRPEAIKMAPVIKELAKHERARSIVCVTGQHRQMLDQVLSLFHIQPDYDLNLMQSNQTLSGLTGSLFTGLEGVVSETKPDWILAQGDTTTVLVACLVAYYHRIRFGHVEAGLRTGNKYKPFPEEINRRVADLVADAFFTPTERARRTLLDEGVDEQAIFVTGNTVVDALLEIASQPYDWQSGALAGIPQNGRLVLITAHRRESFGEPFQQMCSAIRTLALRFADVHFVYPVHLNPNVQKPVRDILAGMPNVSLIEPLDYLTIVHLMKASALILTDSGGIQEEAPSFSVPVLVMREETERPEGVEAGVVKLVGTQADRIVAEADRMLRDAKTSSATTTQANPYGDGQAARRIVSVLLNGKLPDSDSTG